MKTDASKSWFKRHEKAIAFSVSAVFLIIGLYFERDNIKQLGIPLSFNDVVQALGQFATVGAFWIAFQQLKKSKEDAAEAIRREQQKYCFDEALVYLGEMTRLTREFIPERISIFDLIGFLHEMTAHAVSFKDHADKLTDPMQRNIMIRHWQNMYFVELIPKLHSVNLVSQLVGTMFRKNIGDVEERAQLRVEAGNYADFFSKFFHSKFVLEELHDMLDRGIQSKLHSESGIYMLFKKYFFDPDYIEPLLVGTANRPDMRSIAPAIAALYDRYCVFKNWP